MAISRPRKAVYGLLVTAVALLALEGGLRVATRQLGRATIPDDTIEYHLRAATMRYDEELGWTWEELPSTGLGINAQGLRYPTEISERKPEGTWRAFTLGDSQTYGAGVDAHQTYTAYAEEELRRRAPDGVTVELLNAGISGYTSLQALRLIRLRLLAFDPDLLVVDCRTFDSPREDGLRDQLALNPVDRWLFGCRIYYVLRFAVERTRSERPRAMRAAEMSVGADELRASFGNHALTAELAEAKGIDLLFGDYPFWDGEQVWSLAPEHELPAGVPIVRFNDALRESGYAPSELFMDNNHLTILGNHIAGRALAEAILEEGMLEGD